MLDSSWLWALFTVIAAAAQTVRNATQRELTATLGTAGATHVRFLFGLPFALVFLLVVLVASGAGAAAARRRSTGRGCLQGALAQIAATALMLAAMSDRSFVVVYAYIKTEPVQAALFGLVFLGDAVTLPMARGDPDRHHRRRADGAQARHHARRARDAARPRRRRHVRAVGGRLSRRDPEPRPAELSDGGDLHAGGRPRHPVRAAVGSICGCASPRCSARSRGTGGRRCWPASSARSPRSSGSWPSRSRPPPACARSRWSRCCSRRRSRRSCSSRRRRAREALGIVLIVIGVAALVWAY